MGRLSEWLPLPPLVDMKASFWQMFEGRNDEVEGCGKICLKGRLHEDVGYLRIQGNKIGVNEKEGDGRPGCGTERINNGRVRYLLLLFLTLSVFLELCRTWASACSTKRKASRDTSGGTFEYGIDTIF